MFLSDELLHRAYSLYSEKEYDQAKSVMNFFIRQVGELRCHDYLTFGTLRICEGCKPEEYNIRTPLSWEILEKQGNRLLLISEFCIDWNLYDGSGSFLGPAADTTWENSTIRKDLNGDFIENTFSKFEQMIIAETEVRTKPNPICGNNPGNDTKDRLFLLSADEVVKYFTEKYGNPLSDYRTDCIMCDITDLRQQYHDLGNFSAKADILMADVFDEKINIGRYAYQWWLRTPGSEQKKVCVVTPDGRIDFGGVSSSADEIGVRPAMWIDLDVIKNLIFNNTEE